jgi:Fur family ferric uptake transcriptional regulator
MSCEGRFQSELHRRGLRVTPQREVILSALHRFRAPFTVEEVFSQVVVRHPGIKLSTVYRTLELLRSINLVSVVDVDSRGNHYLHSVEEAPHFHLVCHRCESVTGVEADEILGFRASILNKYGFELEVNRLILGGLCEECRRNES